MDQYVKTIQNINIEK